MSLQLGPALIEPNPANPHAVKEVITVEKFFQGVIIALDAAREADRNAIIARQHANAAVQHADTHAANGAHADLVDTARQHADDAIDNAFVAEIAADIAAKAYAAALDIRDENIPVGMAPETPVSAEVAFRVATQAINAATAARNTRHAEIAAQRARQLAAGLLLTGADITHASDTVYVDGVYFRARQYADRVAIAFQNAAAALVAAPAPVSAPALIQE